MGISILEEKNKKEVVWNTLFHKASRELSSRPLDLFQDKALYVASNIYIFKDLFKGTEFEISLRDVYDSTNKSITHVSEIWFRDEETIILFGAAGRVKFGVLKLDWENGTVKYTSPIHEFETEHASSGSINFNKNLNRGELVTVYGPKRAAGSGRYYGIYRINEDRSFEVVKVEEMPYRWKGENYFDSMFAKDDYVIVNLVETEDRRTRIYDINTGDLIRDIIHPTSGSYLLAYAFIFNNKIYHILKSKIRELNPATGDFSIMAKVPTLMVSTNLRQISGENHLIFTGRTTANSVLYGEILVLNRKFANCFHHTFVLPDNINFIDGESIGVYKDNLYICDAYPQVIVAEGVLK